jgi:hypothetical protein
MNSWVMFVGIVSVAYLARFGKIESVDYSNLWVKNDVSEIRGKRILVLEDSLDLYNDNFLATPFLNWKLSQNIFRHPDYYENVTKVYHAFKTDPPEVVIDKENLLENFFERMPEIRSGYLRQGDRYIRKTNN